MAYPTDLAAALSGATVRQLSYWRRPNANGSELLVPELHDRNPMLYSFRDVLALRTFVYLRESHSLQRVRKAVANLRDLGNREHLATYRLISTVDSIALEGPDGRATDVLRSPGQVLLDVPWSNVLEQFDSPRGTVVDLFRPRENLGVDPGICGGYPVVAGTRVLFDEVASLVADGVPPDRIDRYFPGVSAEAAADAVSLAAEVEQTAAG